MTNFIQRLQTRLLNQPDRYKKKGYGFISFFLAFCYFFILPSLLKYVWPYYISLAQPRTLFCVTSYLINIFFHSAGHLFYYFVYTKKINLEKYRVDPTKPWPWQVDRQAWNNILKKSIKLISLNSLVLAPFLLYFSSFDFKYKIDIDLWPTGFDLIRQFLFFLIFESISNYFIHRLLHHPYLYPKFHKIHHQYSVIVTVSAQHFHPLEFATANSLPVILGPTLFILMGNNLHLVSFILWTILKITENIDGHSGYQLPWSPYRIMPFSTSVQYHYFHHYQNIGNYDTVGVLDTIFGTNIQYMNYQKMKDENKIN